MDNDMLMWQRLCTVGIEIIVTAAVCAVCLPILLGVYVLGKISRHLGTGAGNGGGHTECRS